MTVYRDARAGTVDVVCPWCNGRGVVPSRDRSDDRPYQAAPRGRCGVCDGQGDFPLAMPVSQDLVAREVERRMRAAGIEVVDESSGFSGFDDLPDLRG